MEETVPIAVNPKPRSKGRGSGGGRGGRGQKDSESHGKQESHAEKLARQIFVGGLPSSITQEKFREWADETWPGTVTQAQIIYTNSFHERQHQPRPRGFGFLTFCDAKCVEKALENRFLPFGPKTVEVKKAEDFRGKKVKGRKEQTSSSTSAVENETSQNAQKLDSPASSYPRGPSELVANTPCVDVDENTAQESTSCTVQSAAAECLRSAGGESQGPVQATVPPGSPLRQQNHSPRPSQGPQCTATPDRRSGRRGNGTERRAKAGKAEGKALDCGDAKAASASHSDELGRRGKNDSTENPATPKMDSKDSTSPKNAANDDSIRQFLRDRWDAAVSP